MDITVVGQQSTECIPHIISLTVPRDACKSSVVCHVFKSAADSDSVGEVSVVRLQRDRFQLCLGRIFVFIFVTTHLYKNGTMSFAAEQSGKKCYVIGARGLCAA